jgi:glycosyltransferase involved in cell wall biosynthesis
MRAVFAIPGDIQTRTGGYIYDSRVMALLPALGIDVVHLRLPASFPYPSADDLQVTRVALAAVDAEDIIVADGLFWGACPAEFAQATHAKIIALCHHPLGLEAGLSEAQSRHFLQNEREILFASDHVIVTSSETARTLAADFTVPAEKITVAEPGTDIMPRAKGSVSAHKILAVGSIVPRKGYDMLVEALASLRDLPWRCTIAGSLRRAPEFARQLKAQIEAHGLGERIILAGEVEDAAIAQLYAGADIFVSASHYEGYGMVLTEALARGLPIVTTTGGAAGSTVPDDCALKVPPGNAAALSASLRLLLDDRSLRATLSDRAWTQAQVLQRWEDTAAIVAATIRQVAAQTGTRR